MLYKFTVSIYFVSHSFNNEEEMLKYPIDGNNTIIRNEPFFVLENIAIQKDLFPSYHCAIRRLKFLTLNGRIGYRLIFNNDYLTLVE